MGILDFLRNSEKKTESAASKSDYVDEILNKLLADRIIFLGTPIDDAAANKVIAEMLYLEHQSPREDINLYLNSPGGSITASFAIYDTIKSIKPDVTTVCLGQASGTAALLLAAGAQGKRFVQPSSRVVIYEPQPSEDPKQNVRVMQNELARMRELIVKVLVEDTRMTPRQAHSLMQRDKILSAEEAIELGFADAIVTK